MIQRLVYECCLLTVSSYEQYAYTVKFFGIMCDIEISVLTLLVGSGGDR